MNVLTVCFRDCVDAAPVYMAGAASTVRSWLMNCGHVAALYMSVKKTAPIIFLFSYNLGSFAFILPDIRAQIHKHTLKNIFIHDL